MQVQVCDSLSVEEAWSSGYFWSLNSLCSAPVLKARCWGTNIKERGYEGPKDSALVPGFRIPNVSSFECSLGERTKAFTASKSSELRSQRGQKLMIWTWQCTTGHPLYRQTRVLLTSHGYLWVHVLSFNLISCIDLGAIFLIMTLLLYASHTKERHIRMTVPKVKWSVEFSKIAWREPTGWENAKICISLKCNAIFELLIEKKKLNCK